MTALLRLLRLVALVAMLIGGAGSVALTVFTGRNNKSWLLIVVFIIWVLSPFVAMQWATRRSRTGNLPVQAILHSVIIVLSALSLAVYSGVIAMPEGSARAFPFVVFPAVALVVLGVVVAGTGAWSGRPRPPA